MTGLRPYALRCDHRTTPLGIGEPAPLLSWRLVADDSAGRGVAPAAYRLQVAPDLDGTPYWDSGRVEDPEATGAVYGGPPLRPRTRYHWSVTVWTADGEKGRAESWFETALDAAGWRASWIARDWTIVEVVDPPEEGERALDAHGLLPCPLLRRAFSSRTVPVRARLYVSARGLYEMRINGERVGDSELAPGWTDYRYRVQFQTYDVTALIVAGANVLAATLADGWWSGYVGFDPRRPGGHYGRFPQLIAQLHLDHQDGSFEVIGTDERWRTADGPVRHADLLMGECHDARRAIEGWDRADFDDGSWAAARVVDDDTTRLVPSVDEPVRAVGALPPVAVTRVGPAAHIVDFGQNFAGRIRLTASGLRSGQRIVVRHAEALDHDGGLYTANLRTAAATDMLIAGAGGAAGADRQVVFEPRFTYHGFRYAEVTGLGELSPGDITGVVLHSDTPPAGTFDCSDPEIRRLHENITWGRRSNFVSVPTDCPQRDERLGWLADAQVFLPTACLGADVAAFFAKWMRDVLDAQGPDGGFSNVAPRIAGVAEEGAPGWADAGVLIPWHLYRTYGDERILTRSLDGMCAWVDFVHRHNPDLVWHRKVGPHFGDWLAIGRPTPREVIATAYFARSAELTARAASAVRAARAGRYAALAREIRATFVARFAGQDGRIVGDTQTAYLLALAFELLPAQLAALAARRLGELVEEAGPGLTTGFLGVGLIAPVLDQWGRSDLVHALLRRERRPSWLYPLRHGATTVWERWDGYTEESGFQAPAMNSFNHYALGSVGEWLYRGLAGLDQAPGSVAYRELVIRPRPFDGASWAAATYESARGTIAVRWRRDDDDGFRLDVDVPPGATATVHVPAPVDATVWEGDHPAGESPGVEFVGIGPDAAGGRALVYRVESGGYRFLARRTE